MKGVLVGVWEPLGPGQLKAKVLGEKIHGRVCLRRLCNAALNRFIFTLILFSSSKYIAMDFASASKKNHEYWDKQKNTITFLNRIEHAVWRRSSVGGRVCIQMAFCKHGCAQQPAQRGKAPGSTLCCPG